MAVILTWCALAAGLLFVSTTAGIVDFTEGCVPNLFDGAGRCHGVLCGFLELATPTLLPRGPCYALDLAFFVGLPAVLLFTTSVSHQQRYYQSRSRRSRRQPWDAAPGGMGMPAAGGAGRLWRRRQSRGPRGGFDPHRLGIDPTRRPRA